MYHIREDGNPGRCAAPPGRCPFGGSHYETEGEVRNAIEELARDLLFRGMRKVVDFEDPAGSIGSTEFQPDIDAEACRMAEQAHKLIAAADPDERLRLASDPETPVDLLHELLKDEYQHASIPPLRKGASVNEKLMHLGDAGKSEANYLRIAVGRNEGCPPELLDELSRHSHRRVRASVAINPSTPKETLNALAEDDTGVRSYLAQNPATPQDTLSSLSRDSEAVVRMSVAKNISSPSDALTRLSEDADREVRGRVASNPSTPLDILRRLARGDRDSTVRICATSNRAAPVELVMDVMLNERDPNVNERAHYVLRERQRIQA